MTLSSISPQLLPRHRRPRYSFRDIDWVTPVAPIPSLGSVVERTLGLPRGRYDRQSAPARSDLISDDSAREMEMVGIRLVAGIGLGSEEDIGTRCRSAVAHTIAHGSYFYIGITASPTQRWLQAHSQSFDRMLVIHAATTSAATAQVERSLLTTFREHAQCLNVGPGGERPSSGSPHYVYIVSRERGSGRVIRRPARLE